MSVALALYMAFVGLIYAPPGILPAAADMVTASARRVSGVGLIVAAIPIAAFGIEPMTGAGIAIVASGLLAFAYCIARQPCAPKA